MKKRISLAIILVMLCTLVLTCFVACSQQTDEDVLVNKGEWTIKSPDGTISVELIQDPYNNLTYQVKKDGTIVIGESALGLEIAEDDFSFINIQKQSSRKIKGSYDNISGKTDHVDYECNETIVTFKAWSFYYDIVVRAYDDGYAFRYNVRKIDGSEGVMTVLNEKTEFAFPEEANMWAQEYVTNKSTGDFFSYEVFYQKRYIPDLNSAQYIAMPFIYEIPGTSYYSLITESELVGSNFYGSFLKVPEGAEGESVLKTEHTPAGITVDDNKVSYPFSSPWRVGIVGDMKTIQESELTETVYYSGEEDYTDLYWKPDNYDELSAEEQAIYNYDWVEPGVTAWNWLIYNGKRGQDDYNLHREYVQLAKEMGWKYVILDGGWNGNFNENSFVGFMQEAERAGIKVLVWCNALTDFGNGNIDILKTKLDLWQKWGIAGIKIDFFDGQNATDQSHQGEDIGTIKWYEAIYQECAKRKMVVNCHGSNKPTGERVVYPNVINREGIYGNEFYGVGANVTVNQLLIRNVVGPSDFTPVVNPLSNNITKAHQMALAVLFESGSPSMADYAKAYRESDIYSFYKSIPSVREKTVFLGGKLDYYYSAAVKAGNYWFVGAANSLVKQDFTVDFSFLDDGEYVAEVYNDDPDSGKIVKETITVTKNDKKTFTMQSKGGFVIRLYKND